MLAVKPKQQLTISLALFVVLIFIFVDCKLRLSIDIRCELGGIAGVALRKIGAFLGIIGVSCCRRERIDFFDDLEDWEALVASKRLLDGQAKRFSEVLELKVQLQIPQQEPVFHLAHEQNYVSLVIPFLLNYPTCSNQYSHDCQTTQIHFHSSYCSTSITMNSSFN